MRSPLILSSIVWLGLLVSTATALPRIFIVSPPPNQPLYDVEPLIKVNYSQTGVPPVPPLNLATLHVVVNGVDWTSKFTVGASSASYDVAPGDRLIAGSLVIAASIQDTTGAPASDQKTYAVFPTLQGLSPDEGAQGAPVVVSGLGLDPNPAANVLAFTSYTGSTVPAPFVSVDPAAGEGTVHVPDGSVTGPVRLSVNSRASQETLPFTVIQTFPVCGAVFDARFMGDGSLLVLYRPYFVPGAGYPPADPRCPVLNGGGSFHVVVLREFPNGNSTIVMDLKPDSSQNEDIHGIAVDKVGTKFAVITWQAPGTPEPFYLVYYGNGVILSSAPPGFIVTKFSGFMYGDTWHLSSDIDADGNLLFPAWDALLPPPRLIDFYRLPLSVGGTVTPEVIATLPPPASWSLGAIVKSFQVPCTGPVVVGLSQVGGQGPEGRVWRVDLPGGSLVRDESFPQGLARAATTCESDTVLGTTDTVVGSPLHTIGIWRMHDQEEVATLVVSPPQQSPGGTFALSSDGAAYVSNFAFPTQGYSLVRVPDMIDQCSFPGGGPPTSQSFPCAPLKVLPTTTRWKPQRGDEPIEVHFYSPYELSSATLEIKGPNQEPMTLNPIPVLEGTTEPPPNDVPFTYKLVWQGPWTTTVNGETVPLPRGNYSATVTGIRLDGQGTVGSASYGKISLVEVKEVQLLTILGQQLEANPDVGKIPGQNPEQDRAAGGKRIFAESAVPGGPILNRVQVIAKIDPAVFPDPQVPTSQATVRVHFKSFDVDDPAPYEPDADGDLDANVNDNRGTPKNGTLDGAPEDPYVDVVPGQTDAITHLAVSGQPGDNYRVVASTSFPWLWLPTLVAKQPSSTGKMIVPLDAETTQVSDMLTVWRTMNIEMESIAAPPPPTASPLDSGYKERNFIRGLILKVTRNGAQGPPTIIDLRPELTIPPLLLDDGSQLLGEDGSGRFENGHILIGTDLSSVLVGSLDGNGIEPGVGGAEYVRKSAGITLPAVFAEEGSPPLTAYVLEWDAAQHRFVMDRNITGWFSTVAVGGVTWSVQSINGSEVIVSGGQPLPFYLEDDDQTQYPFDPNRCLMSDSQQAPPGGCSAPSFPPGSWWEYSAYAQAYIRPRFVGSDILQLCHQPALPVPPFNRNVSCPGPTTEICDDSEFYWQLEQGRDICPTDQGFWSFYFQGAFQQDEVHGDLDPKLEEPSVLGRSPLNDLDGGMVFMETIHDSAVKSSEPELEPRCSARTLVHELGHQFGLVHSGDGFMQQGTCLFFTDYFLAPELGKIRQKGLSQ